MRIKLLVGPRPEASTPITAVTKDPDVASDRSRQRQGRLAREDRQSQDPQQGAQRRDRWHETEAGSDPGGAQDTPMDPHASDYKTRQFIDYLVQISQYNGFADYVETATKAVWEHSVKEKVPKVIEEAIQNVRNIQDSFADGVVTADREPFTVLIDAIAAVLEEEKYRIRDTFFGVHHGVSC